MLFPVNRPARLIVDLPSGILIPMSDLAGKRNYNHVWIPVSVKIIAPGAEPAAVPFGAIVCCRLANLMHLPIGCFIPDVTGQDIQLAVLIYIGHLDSFRPKRRVHYNRLET